MKFLIVCRSIKKNRQVIIRVQALCLEPENLLTFYNVNQTGGGGGCGGVCGGRGWEGGEKRRRTEKERVLLH